MKKNLEEMSVAELRERRGTINGLLEFYQVKKNDTTAGVGGCLAAFSIPAGALGIYFVSQLAGVVTFSVLVGLGVLKCYSDVKTDHEEEALIQERDAINNKIRSYFN